MKSPFAFTQLGTTARDCLIHGQRGKVLAVLSKVIYLLTEAGELFWITTGEARMHRRCAVVSPPLPGLEAGAPFQVQNHHLRLHPDFIFEIDNPSLWTAPRANRILEITSIPARLHCFFPQLDFSQTKGFGNFIPEILSISKNETINSSLETHDPILRAAQPLALGLARACLEKQPSRLPSLADKLIGFGSGLTPSGDDFLGGLMFAVHHLQTAFPDFDFTDYKLQIEAYRSRTPLISFTLLKDHANGHASESLHHIVNGILSGESFESISPFVSQLTRIGHSTGWDMLTGLLTGLLITIPSATSVD